MKKKKKQVEIEINYITFYSIYDQYINKIHFFIF